MDIVESVKAKIILERQENYVRSLLRHRDDYAKELKREKARKSDYEKKVGEYDALLAKASAGDFSDMDKYDH